MIISGRGQIGMGVMGRFVGGGGWQGKRVDWVPLFQCFFFLSLFL